MHGIVRDCETPGRSAGFAHAGALTGAKGQPIERAGVAGDRRPATPASRLKAVDTELVGNAWPVDLDEVPAWVLAAERRRADLGITQPLPARTRRQFEAKLARAAQIVLAGEVRKVSPDEAAERFVAHVRAAAPAGKATELSNDALAAAYRTFCSGANIECPDNFFRAALKLTPGARRQETVVYKPRRIREVVWVIEPAAESDRVSAGNRGNSATMAVA